MKRLSFTVSAFARLDEIYAFSVDRFGRRKAEAYHDTLIRACRHLCSGQKSSQSCRALFSGLLRADLRFARTGRHFVIFIDLESEIRVIDVVHQSANVLRRLEKLT